MFLLENFPNELLEMITGHHKNISDILILSEVSPRFNNLISKSARLSKKIIIVWSYKKDSLSVPEKRRKYSDLILRNVQWTIEKVSWDVCRLNNFYSSVGLYLENDGSAGTWKRKHEIHF